MRKFLVGLLLALSLSALPTTPAHAGTVDDEAGFVSRINALRASKGLSTLTVHPNLVGKARDWAQTMGSAGKIWHSKLSDGITADWQKLGENVGMGSAVESLHNAFVASPKHYENLVDPEFGYVGIGVVYVDGTTYVSEMFMKMADAVTPAPVVAAPPVAPTTPAPAPVPAPKPKAQPKPKPAPGVPAPVVPAPAPAPAPVPVPLAPMPAPTPVAAPAPVAVPAPVPAPEAAPPAPVAAVREPSALLVSVLERLRTFD